MKALGYSTQRVWLHWLSAAVIVWTLISGFYVATVDVSPRINQWVSFLNVSLTTVFIPFFVWRLCVFVAHARHTGVRTFNPMERLALLVHTLIYLVISLVLVTGVLMMDRPINVFGVVEIVQPLSNRELVSRFFTIHMWACVVLSLLVVLHVGAVIVHELCGHRVLHRMSLCSRVRGEQRQ
jgi:cytochrome b561